jgi:hypothetical protein
MNAELIIQNIGKELAKFTLLGLPGLLVAPIKGYHFTDLGDNEATLQVIISQAKTPRDSELRQEFYGICTELHERFKTMDMNALLGIDILNNDEKELFYLSYNTDWALQLYKNKAEDTILVQFTDTALVMTFTECGINANY